MWLRKLLDIINKPTDKHPPQEFYVELSKVNPSKFYVENVRSVLGISTAEAKRVCDDGVAAGTFSQGTEFVCPDNSVALSVEDLDDIPEKLECWEEIDGEYEPIEYEANRLAKRTYYRFAAAR